MTRAELEALADRVEREQPSDDINELVRVAVGANRIKNSAGDMDPPAYTTSLDAAVTLVPSDAEEIVIRIYPTGGVYARSTTKNGHPVYCEDFAGKRLPPAAALTAAALRARAKEAWDE